MNMTKENLMKALECCVNVKNCKKCPLASLKKTNDCKHILWTNTLELINLQDKRNYNLKLMLNSLKSKIIMYKKAVGDLAIRNDEVVALLNGTETEYILKSVSGTMQNLAYERGRSEAIKEFTERPKEKMTFKEKFKLFLEEYMDARTICETYHPFFYAIRETRRKVKVGKINER